MARARYWVGLDVGADTMTCCIIDDDGGVVSDYCLANNAADLRAILKPIRKKVSMVALESGSFGTHLTRSLVRLGFPVAQFDARKASKFLGIRQNKTDKNDARGIAEIARVGQGVVSAVRLKTLEAQNLRSILATRQKLVRVRVAVEGIIRSLIRLNGGKFKRVTSANILVRNVTRELMRLRKDEKVDLRQEIEPMLSLCQTIRSYVQHTDERLRAIAEANSTCSRFMQIPGVGPICAISFYSAIDEPSRFKRSADVGAYLGMTPRMRQSGQSTSRLRISRMGSQMTRAHLVMAAGNHLQYADSAIREWGVALRDRAGAGRARVAVARKLAVVMLSMWKSGQDYISRPVGSRATELNFPCGEAAGLETEPEPGDDSDPDFGIGQAC